MIDNKKVKDSHQEGIERVKLRKEDMQKGQHGAMGGGWNHGKGGKKEDHFKRPDSDMTPRRG